MSDDLLALIIRSGFTEGAHYGAAVLVDSTGAVIGATGDPERPIFLRSCAKPLQGVAMVRAGLRLPPGPLGGTELLAVACSSHSGEPRQVDGVLRILASAGLGPERLQNTPDHPLDAAERVRWYRANLPPSSLAQVCSGKHAAMLATCVANGWELGPYLDPDHPLQQQIRRVIEDLTGASVSAVGVDGCGAPVHALPLSGLARAFSRLALAGAGEDVENPSAEAQVARAMRANPQWLGGTGRWVTRVMEAVPGLVAKDGAEGAFAASLPDGRALAIKVADGGERPVAPVVTALLARLGVDQESLTGLEAEPVLGQGQPVGAVVSALNLR